MTQWNTVAQRALNDYCERYFKSVGAQIRPSPRDTLTAELPRDIDKELTDRPFYWMWVEAMNEEPPNTVLYLKFRSNADEIHVPEGAKPELIVPGCYRLLRIYASAKQRGMFGVAYERGEVLTPYAVFVIKVSFISDRRQDFLESYAIDPRDYAIYPNAMDALLRRKLEDERPRAARILSVPLDVSEIFKKLYTRVAADVARRDHRWAKEARTRLQGELTRLERYYESLSAPQAVRDDSDARREREDEARAAFAAERELRRAELMWRTEPKIEVHPTQLAYVYLAEPPTL